MNKQFLSMLIMACVISQSAQAAGEHKSSLARFTCDVIGLVWPTLLSGREVPVDATDERGNLKYGVPATQEQINAKDYIQNWDGRALAKKPGEDAYQPSAPTDVDKAVVKRLQTENENRAFECSLARQEYHYEWAKKIFDLKSGYWPERAYLLAFCAVAAYSGLKGMEYLNTYIEDQKGIDFDEFADEEEVVQKVEPVQPIVQQ